MTKLLVKQKEVKKTKTKKDKKKAHEARDSDSESANSGNDKKSKDVRNGKGKTSTLRRIANSFSPGPPPTPPARPNHKDKTSKREKTAKKQEEPAQDETTKREAERKTQETEPAKAAPAPHMQGGAAPAPHMQGVLKELGSRSALRKTSPAKNEEGSSDEKGTNHVGTTAVQQRQPAPAPPDQRKLSAPNRNEVKPSATSPMRPPVMKAMSVDAVVPTPRGSSTSPVPRPRNRPPPPPPGSTTSAGVKAVPDVKKEEEESAAPLQKPRPKPRPRPRGRLGSTGSVKDGQLENESETKPPFVKLRPVHQPPSAPASRENAASPHPQSPRRPSVDSKPARQPPKLPEGLAQSRLGDGEKNESVAGKWSAPALRPTVPGAKPTVGVKPRPPVKPAVPPQANTKATGDVQRSPKAEQILQLSQKGQSKVHEILALTDARSMDNSQSSLLDVIEDFRELSAEILENFSSLTDSLGPQGRFKLRRTVTNVESKLSDMISVVDTVGSHPTTVEMELIGKAVTSMSNALDEMCIALRSTPC